eukprot:5187361-Pyramimonas_sp.AAC.1
MVKLLADGAYVPATSVAAGDSGFIVASWGADDRCETTFVNSRPQEDGAIGVAKVIPPQPDGKKKMTTVDEEDGEEFEHRPAKRRPAAADKDAARRPAAAPPAQEDGVPALAAGKNNLQLQAVAGHSGASTVVLRTTAKENKHILNV